MTARIVTLDIERLSAIVEVWGLGDKQYIQPSSIIEPSRTICLAWKWEGESKTHFASEWEDTHEGMIRKAHAVMDEADYVIGWNSARFDVKHLNGHFLAYGLLPPSPHTNIDLMVNVKRNFEFMSNRMAYIAETLRIDGKAKTPPGLWRDLRSEDPVIVDRARGKMKKYNKRDVELTEELYYILRPWLIGINLGSLDETVAKGESRCPNCNSANLRKKGLRGNSTYTYQRFVCNDCGKWSKARKSIKSVGMAGLV